MPTTAAPAIPTPDVIMHHGAINLTLLESVYEVVLARDLVRMGFRVERQRAVSFEFEGTTFEDAFRPDLIIDNTVIVEVKSRSGAGPGVERQLLTYLKIMNLRLGLVMNFGMATMKAGIRRIAN